MANPVPGDDDYEGFSPAETVQDTEGVFGSPVAPSPGSPGSMQGVAEQAASNQDTTGTTVTGVPGAALPGGSTSDTIPWSGSGQLGGETGPGLLQGNSGYAVNEVVPGQYGAPLGSPDTEGVYGGAKPTSTVTPSSPYPWLPTSTQLTGTLDTTISGGSDYVPSMYPSPPAYRAPSSYVAAGVKDTTLTDILGNQISAQPLTDASYAALNVDTSYIGAPAAPAPLSSQTDTFAGTAAATPYYASQQGIMPSTLVVTDSGQVDSKTDTIAVISHLTPSALSKTGIITAPSAIVVTDTTTSHVLVITTDYTLTASGSGATLTYSIERVNTSVNSADGDTWTVAYQYADATHFTPAVLVLNTDYTVTTALNGGNTSAYITLSTGSGYVAGDTVALAYSYGTPQYYDSNLPAAQNLTVTDTLQLSQVPAQLLAWNVITSAGSITVFDVTQNASLTYNTDYTVKQIIAPYTPNSTYTETPPITYAISWKPTSTTAKLGDVITATYAYSTSVPGAPGLAATTLHTDSVTSFTSTPTALSQTGIVTPPAGFSVLDVTNGKTLVLNLDYTVTVSGTGSSLTYSVSRLAGSTNSTSTDHVTFSYYYGNTAYFTSGPVLPVNLGVQIPWTPPAGTTNVDYYFIQCSDLGTMYVPATGQPGLYGQPSPSGGADSGQPVYQVDTFTTAFSHSSPNTLTKTGILTPPGQLIVRDLSSTESDPLQPTGTVLEYGYDYTVTSSGVGPWVSYQVQRVATSVNSKDGDTITVSYWYDTMGAVPLTAIGDTVIAAAKVATLSHNDVAIPLTGLIIYDTTISKALAYGLDFTAQPSGEGPVESATITLITTGPAGAGATDHLTVYYLYGIMPTAIFTQGLLPNAAPIYTPSGTVRSIGPGYQFAVAAGNRAGLGPFSNWSDYASPLNYNAPQPGSQGSPNNGPGYYDPANTVNPIYLPSGAVKTGTGLGV
jgi:hypothetical protein